MVYNEQEIREHYHRLTRLLIEKQYTITTMESATSGQIASLITDTEGSSAVLKGAFITYSNEAKILQGVPAEIIEKYTVYSRETAEAMAAACMKAYGARIGIGVTGTMGNVDPANSDASVLGQVYFAIGMDNGICGGDGTTSGQPVIESFHLELAPQPSRLMYKLAVAEEVYKVLIGKLV
ncbi:MAG: CinA family protein [Lachnospiraceae bacterium]|nr:CinA family protein [Lachnospiraceae bacterium]